MQRAVTHSQFARWRAAIFVVFLSSGLAIATWASRVPDIKIALDIDKTQVGLLLLGMGVASILGISSGPVVLMRTGPRIGILAMMLTFGTGVVLIGVGSTTFTSVPLVVLGLVLFGYGNGCVDVMMNVEATAIEQRMGKTVLPVFHAFFSFGTVIGAGAGALAAHFAITVATHATIVGIGIVVIAILCFINIPAQQPAVAPAITTDSPRWSERVATSFAVWKEPRIWGLGVVMLGMAFAEGGANDWLALGVVEGHGAVAATGAAALTVFSVAMTVVRLFGGPLVDKFGRVIVLRVLGITAAAGILLFILADGNIVLVFTASALWGIGASLGFPLGMSAAADDPAKAAARVSACATIGYVAFLGGPPILGLVSEHVGLLNTLYALVVLAALSCLFSGAARALRPDEISTPEPADTTSAKAV